jgi:hypothetical protein
MARIPLDLARLVKDREWKLYQSVRALLREHCDASLEPALALAEEELLTFYTKAYDKYSAGDAFPR